MLEIKNLFFGRIWSVNSYNGNGFFNVSLTDNKYRVFNLIKNGLRYKLVDIESGKDYPLDIDKIVYDKYFVYSEDVKSFREVFPILNFPTYLSVKDALEINKSYNEMNMNNDDKNEIKQVDMNESLSKKNEPKLVLKRP